MSTRSCLDHAKTFRSMLREATNNSQVLEMLRNAALEQKLGLAVQTQNGNFYTDAITPRYGPDKEFFMAWLSWVQSSHSTALQWWHWMQRLDDEKLNEMAGDDKELLKNLQELRDMERDDYVLKLWESMAEGKPNYGGQITVAERLTHWSYYQNHFFQWFLQRFNVPAALSVFKNGHKAARLYPVMTVLTIAVVTIYWTCFSMIPLFWGVFFVLILLVLWIVIRSLKVPLNYAAQAMLPRLGVTIGIGYLYLFSAGSLVNYVFGLNWPWIAYLLISLGLFTAVCFYLIQTIFRRVKPQLRHKRSILIRGWFLMMMAMTYSAIGLHISVPILSSCTFLGRSVQPKPLELLVLGSVALAIGVALQLVWEDNPVTEPL